MSTSPAAVQMYWRGASGQRYQYLIFNIGIEFPAGPGNYIFAREVHPNSFVAIYIGETENLAERFDSHHKMPCIRRNYATHIHVHSNYGGKRARQMEESDLVDRLYPVCNG